MNNAQLLDNCIGRLREICNCLGVVAEYQENAYLCNLNLQLIDVNNNLLTIYQRLAGEIAYGKPNQHKTT